MNLLNRLDFDRMFSVEKPKALLAEHVWEHMTREEGVEAAKNCFAYLADGGYLRVAVPDGNFRNPWYQNMVKVGGNGDPNHPIRTKSCMIIVHLRRYFWRQVSKWNFWNGVTKQGASISNTGMRPMAALEDRSGSTPGTVMGSSVWFPSYWMPRSRGL